MKIRTLLIGSLLAVVGVFAAANWPAFTARSTVNVLVDRIEAPLGLVMLAALALMSVLYLLFLMQVEGRALLDTRQATKALEKARKQAESSEESRFTGLREFLHAEFEMIHQELADLREAAERAATSAPAGVTTHAHASTE